MRGPRRRADLVVLRGVWETLSGLFGSVVISSLHEDAPSGGALKPAHSKNSATREQR